MKTLIYSILLCCIALPVFADSTNFSSEEECYQAMLKYDDEAFARKQPDLAYWFSSFAIENRAVYDSKKNTAIFYEGCKYIGSNSDGQKLWLKIQQKLIKQIDQLKSGQPSLFGRQASLVCGWDAKNHTIDFNSCQ